MSQIIKFPCTNAVVPISYIRRFYACFIAVACTSCVRFAAVLVRRARIFAVRWNFVISVVESEAVGTVVLSCQNNVGSACHEGTFIRSEEYNAPYIYGLKAGRFSYLFCDFRHK